MNFDTFPVPSLVPIISNYYERGLYPGPYLDAILSNDLIGLADNTRSDIEVENAFKIVAWLYRNMPALAFGGRGRYRSWRDRGGQTGRMLYTYEGGNKTTVAPGALGPLFVISDPGSPAT